MPSVAAHMICVKLVSENLKINDKEFIKGNLLPDILDMSAERSHLKIKGKYYEIPDIQKFINKVNLKNNLALGYLSHLLLDRYFLEDYIYDVVNGEEIFLNGKIYEEYDIINYKLLKKFDIDVKCLNEILKNFDVSIDNKKYEENIKSLNNGYCDKKLKYLNLEKFSEFLIDTSNKIVDYIREVKV